MPEQEQGLLHGFQLWVNLPSHAKMTSPAYQEFPAQDVPVVSLENGTQIRIIAGQLDTGAQGAVRNDYTKPIYLDIRIPANSEFTQFLPKLHNAFVYVITGAVQVGHEGSPLKGKQLGILSHGEQLVLNTNEQDARLLLVAGKPLNEPVVRGGPFVMNTREEIQQAFLDYQNGQF